MTTKKASKKKPSKSRKTTGRFDTREQLIERIAFLYNQGEMSNHDIGKNCEVSATTVSKIIDSEEGQAAIEALVAKHLTEHQKRNPDMHVAVIEEPAVQNALSNNPTFQKFEIAKRIAHTLAQSTLVPESYFGRANDCFVAINMGAELGLEPFQAIQSIAVIDNKPCLYGDGLIGVVRSSPLCLWIEESGDDKSATCKTQRKGDPNPITATYTMDDAVRAGINNKPNWKKHPKRMLQMRARAYCLRDAYPDLLKGLGVVEERIDHETTPPPIIEYDLPPPPNAKTPLDQAREVFGEQVDEITLSKVERAMHQSDTMEDLLKAAELAKQLNEQDQGTARITYKKMRKALLETGD